MGIYNGDSQLEYLSHCALTKHPVARSDLFGTP